MTIMSHDKLDLTNHFLIAMPQLSGSYFGHTVVYMWQHGDDGALGIVVNLPLEIKLGEIFSQLDIEIQRPESGEETVLSGGPVETDKGFILHDADRDWQSTLKVTDDIRITTSRDILDDISRGEGPENYLVALGCAGWSPGQLEEEIADNAWITCPASKEIIFSHDFDRKPDMGRGDTGFYHEPAHHGCGTQLTGQQATDPEYHCKNTALLRLWHPQDRCRCGADNHQNRLGPPGHSRRKW